jgi:hypothetical protein
MSNDVRDEAERLVAAALATASVALRGLRDGGFPMSGLADAAERVLSGGSGHVATGTAECCVCPVCRAIAALRDPSPEFALRLATGASDLAAGLSGVMRAFGDVTGRRPAPPPAKHTPDGDVTWRAATRAADDSAPRPPADTDADQADDPWHAATAAE